MSPASVSVTSGLERWLDDQSASAADDGDADAPVAPNDAPEAEAPNADSSDPAADPEIDPEIPKRFLPYTPFEKQRAFHKSPAKYRLFGGAAGPGKSKALLMEAIVQANDNTGVNTLLLRRTFPELEQSLLLYFRRDVPRELYLNFNDAKHVVTWLNGSTTRFGYCAAENDVYQYQGAEFLFIGIDELTLFTLRQWQFLTSRNRCPVPGTFPNMAGATNPGNIGHAWVKSLWIDKQPAGGMENPEHYDPDDYDFIPARVHDNPIYAADENYLKTLAALPSHLRRAFLDGDWDVFAGQYFDRFDVTHHVARAEEIEWKPWWPRWISIDWGFEHPAATYWHAAAPGRDESAPKQTVVTYREYVTHRTAPRDLAHEIIARSLASNDRDAQTNSHPREKIDAIYLSPDAFARRTDEASIADQMGDVFAAAGFPRPVPADNDRIGGWMLMYQMLDANEWLLTDNCIELIRTIPTLVRDMARVEDVEKMEGDDPADAARYGLKSRYATRAAYSTERLPYEARLASRVLSADPTVRAIQARKAQLEEQRSTNFVPRRGR
jgi:phage terminase large subunit